SHRLRGNLRTLALDCFVNYLRNFLAMTRKLEPCNKADQKLRDDICNQVIFVFYLKVTYIRLHLKK
ncbi:MAG: hypothetical protein AB8U11_07035, partial [Rickettsia slovaca]|uniref:hypothetical protein n=1 Tax=Rickettsia slovaca TaxID=35794 RepID=UPI003AEF4675